MAYRSAESSTPAASLRKNEVLNRVYANVLNKPMLIPKSDVNSLGSAIFAALAAGAFRSLEDAQDALCPEYRVVEPDPKPLKRTRSFTLYIANFTCFRQFERTRHFRRRILPTLRRVAAAARGNA